MSPERPPERALRRLELDVRRRIAGTMHGEHPGVGLGIGSDPEELVPYRPGDDVRRIDWNATARTGEPYVWRTRADHALESWVLVDRSPSMAFGTTEREKADVAAWTAAAVGLLAGAGSDRVGLGFLDPSGVRWVRPAAGRGVATRVLRSVDDHATDGGTVSLAAALRRLRRQAPHRGLRVVVSDLVEADGAVDRPFGWEVELRHLAARHDVIVVEVVDPRELSLPDVGEVVLVDPESGTQRQVSTSDPRLRLAFAEGAARHRLATAEAVAAAHADHLVLRTDDDLVRSLSAFLRRRRRTPTRTGSPR